MRNYSVYARFYMKWRTGCWLFQLSRPCQPEMASRFTRHTLNHTHNSHYAGKFWLIQDLHKACAGP